MTDNNMDKIFEELDFNIEEPHSGHRERFFKKLDKKPESDSAIGGKIKTFITPVLGIAASLLVAFLLLGGFMKEGNISKESDLASISPEMKQTQEFYTGLISRELTALNAEKTPGTEAIINDALQQMKKLETRYESLGNDLIHSGKDKRVIQAMIQNFQQRIDLLNEVLSQIETIKNLKNQTHESNII